MTLLELEEQIKSLYDVFFEDMKINKQTGILEQKFRDRILRFSGLPYIGEDYVNAPVKVLFIPLDTGADELGKKNTYRDFDSRRDAVVGGDRQLDFESHMAGLYATALFILKNGLGEQSSWDALWKCKDFKIKKAIKLVSDSLPKDLLKYVAYQNRYKFVTVGRSSDPSYKERSGGKDRVWVNGKRLSELLMAEIEALSPDIIVFQGTDGLWNCHVGELKKKYQVAIAYHPSCYQKGADKLQYIVDKIGPQLKL